VCCQSPCSTARSLTDTYDTSDMPLWTRKLRRDEDSPSDTMEPVSKATATFSATVSPAEHNPTKARILQLPGELRNLIYHFAIYPQLRHLQIMPSRRDFLQRHLNSNTPVLNLPIFHLSQQIRAEALSFLCANKELHIMDLSVAIVFFGAVGRAVGDIKRFVLSQPLSLTSSLDATKLDAFFRHLENATALQFFKLEVTKLRTPAGWDKDLLESDWYFLERLAGFVAGRNELDFMWAIGAYDGRPREQASGSGRAKRLKGLLGEMNEVGELLSLGGRRGNSSFR
jgi:hypothetical protein